MIKEYKNLKFMKTFNERLLPSLSTCTLGALELFVKEGVSKLKVRKFKRPIIVGSGNAKITSQILYQNSDAVFADENNIDDALKRKSVDGMIIFSASGSKHAPIIAKKAQKRNLQIKLVTCVKDSPCEKLIGSKNTLVTSKNREPYTYNTSTYLGWVLAKTEENPKKILEFIDKEISKKISKNLGKYDSYLLVTPNEFEKVNSLFETKFIELFGRQIARDVKTYEELKHAITVVPKKTELCIKFGDCKEEIYFNGDSIRIPLPKKCGPATMMAIGYFVIGKIQEQHKQYFKDNLPIYVRNASKGTFGTGIKIIVE